MDVPWSVVDRLIRDRVARRPEVDRKAVDLTRLDRRRRHILIAIAGPEDALLDQEAISVGEDIDARRFGDSGCQPPRPSRTT